MGRPFSARWYSAAKQEWLATLRTNSSDFASDKKYRELMPVVGEDPLPFGIERNRATIAALESYSYKQKLIPRRMPIEELFVDPDKL